MPPALLFAASVDPVVIGGGTILAIAAAFTIRLMIQASRQMSGQGRRIEDLEARLEDKDDECNRRVDRVETRERRCAQRLNVLVGACHAAGVKIPPEVFSDE